MILDFGCGKRKFPNAIGIDIDPDSDADIIHDLNKPFHFRKANLIRAVEIIEYLDNPKQFIQNCYNNLEGGGVLFLTTNNRDSLVNRIFKNYYHAKTHKSLMNIDELKNLLEGKFNILYINFEPYDRVGKDNYARLRGLLHRFLPNSLRERIVCVCVRGG